MSTLSQRTTVFMEELDALLRSATEIREIAGKAARTKSAKTAKASSGQRVVDEAAEKLPTDSGAEEIRKRAKGLIQERAEANATIRALTIVWSLIHDKYPADMIEKFVRECADMDQWDELEEREKRGEDQLAQIIRPDVWYTLVDALLEQDGFSLSDNDPQFVADGEPDAEPESEDESMARDGL